MDQRVEVPIEAVKNLIAVELVYYISLVYHQFPVIIIATRIIFIFGGGNNLRRRTIHCQVHTLGYTFPYDIERHCLVTLGVGYPQSVSYHGQLVDVSQVRDLEIHNLWLLQVNL